MKYVSIIPIGTEVSITGYKGIVRKIMMEVNYATEYEVSYWKDGTRVSVWVRRDEFEPINAGEESQIGFKQLK